MKRVMCVSMALILAALCVMLVGLRAREESAPAAQRPVLLLTQEDTGAYFMQLRQGILKALDEQNCTLSTQIAEPAAMTDALWGGIEYRGVLIYIQDEALRRQALRSARGQGLPGSGSRRKYSYRDLLELKTIKRLLDIGAQTLLIPFVENAEEARALAGAARRAD